MELAKEIINAMQTGCIDSEFESLEKYRPKLIYNNIQKGNTIASEIQRELSKCNSFMWSVAFVSESGLIVLKEVLKRLVNDEIKGRIITSKMNNFNQPKALRELLKFPNLEVKIYSQDCNTGNDDLHTKGYIFQTGEVYSLIVGSANLTQNALRANKEWNLKVTSLEKGELLKDTVAEYEVMWEEAIPLTEEWIQEYEKEYEASKRVREQQKVIRMKQYRLMPNAMQEAALKNLETLRADGAKKAVLISATGTGKTYLSAFDVRNFAPKKMLFLVHREQILKQAMESFKDVLGESINVGLLSGNHKEYDADYLFSTVQTMSKNDVMRQYFRNHFDYIVIDETHKVGAESYRRIIDYFQPQFMMGMTASPERTDGFDIYELFDHNIAYEIRLQQAMESNLLCPFHYFGISELSINGQLIDDSTEFRYLISDERVSHIIKQANYYGFSGNRVKGLIFCSSNKEANELSKQFNHRGYRTVALSGENSQEEREYAIAKLEQDEYENGYDYIFTVDIFNEGVDIPAINQVIMLRPTQSSIIFVQQLGRGLRKYSKKEYVVVIDFIGNYQNNFLIPIALSGDRSLNKDSIRKYVSEGNRVIPGCSTVNFDVITKERIYQSINDNNLTTLKTLKEEYFNLKNRLGHIPSLMNFYENGSVDPLIFIDKYKSYYTFVTKVDKDNTILLNTEELLALEYVSTQFANGKRPHELLILDELQMQGECSKESIIKRLEEEYQIINDDLSVEKAFSQVNGGFLSGADKVRYSDCSLYDWKQNVVEIEYEQNTHKNQAKICEWYQDRINNMNLKNMIQDVISLGKTIYKDKYSHRYGDTNLVLYEKYSRRDVCRLLNWDSDESSTVYGYKIKHNTCVIFVTYNKSDDIATSTKYEDAFINPQLFSWLTRNNVRWDSKEPTAIFNHKEMGIDIHLFVKKADGEGRDFYYLGKVEPIKEASKETTIQDDKGKKLPIVNIIYRMQQSVREDIYEYLTK
ncbi:MAG: DEAD/DEAH box helicase [Lachnospiraceae bacterium]|nr:DEAD/DEAH box helicase [Lachnospiraceae bacterium]